MSKVVVSAKAIILNDDKFLVLKQSRPGMIYWDLPGGKLEYGETPEEAVIREVKEEVDLEVKPINLMGTWWFYSPVNKYQVICLTYVCEARNFAIDLSKNPADETIKEYVWISKDEFLTGQYPFLHESINTIVRSM